MLTIHEALQLSKTQIARLDVELLLAFILVQPRSFVLAHPEVSLNSTEAAAFSKLLERRVAGEPIAYILGQQEFWSLDLRVNSHVLIPRPETELLVQTVLETLPINERLIVADLGTGSGAIALALATERPQWRIIATDISAAALDLARTNAKQLGLNNVEFILSDWCQDLPNLSYAAILSNPPYLAADDPHLPSLAYEPKMALVAAEQGLQNFREIAEQARTYLAKDGLLCLEHGYEQGEAVQTILREFSYCKVETLKDLATLPRLTQGLNLNLFQ